MVFDPKQDLLTRADEFCARTGMAKSTLATKAVNDGKFFIRLDAGGDFSVGIYSKFIEYFEAHEPPHHQDPEPETEALYLEILD